MSGAVRDRRCLAQSPVAMRARHRISWGQLRPFAVFKAPSSWWSWQIRLQSEALARKFEVSSLGRVKTQSGVTHYGSASSHGYRQVFIERKAYYVHRLVVRAFHGPPPTAAHTCVNHIDRNKANNAVDNLEYATPSGNARHAWATRARSSARQAKPVLYRPVGTGPSWSVLASQSEGARTLGVDSSNLCKCCNGHARSAGGYEFKFGEEALLPGEVWQPAKYPGMTVALSNWMVSSHGRVQTLNGRVTHGSCTASGYFSMLYSRRKEGLQRRLLVHRLVAATFLGQPRTPDLHVNHLDGNPGNNHVNNLEYATPAENMQHAYARMGDCKQQRPNARKPVLAREIDECCWLHFESLKAAAAHTGVHVSSISNVCRGRSDSVKNWLFRFASSQALPDEEWRDVVLDWSLVADEPGASRTVLVPGVATDADILAVSGC